MDTNRARAAIGQNCGAYVLYQTLAVLFFGLPLLPRLATVYAGSGPDPQFMLWSIAWWPYALSHHLNPLHTQLIWAPEGFNLAWSTSNLLQGLLIEPITARFGPVVGLNLLQLIMPALSAWTAFLLIRDLIGKAWPALLGGYLYGFSPFIIGHQMGAHLFASGAFLLPVAAHLTIKHLDRRLTDRWFVSRLALTLIAQFLMGLELLATGAIFGAIALGVACLIGRERRPDGRRTAVRIMIASGVAVLAATPILLPTLTASGMGRHRVWSDHGVDLLELLVPGHAFLLGELFHFDRIEPPYDHFSRDLGGYVGLPILIVAGLFFARRNKRERRRFFAVMLAITYVAALGPALHFGGRALVTMPWRLFDSLPFINSAQAARFAIVVDLLLAIIVAIWIAEAPIRAPLKVALAALVVFSIMPNFRDSSLWASDPNLPDFFTSGEYRRRLGPNENVLLIPYGSKGQAMAWQALTEMYFTMPEGWTGPTPPSFAAWPIMEVFNYGVDIPEKQLQLEAFMGAHDVAAIVIDQRGPDFGQWMELIDRRNTAIEEVGGVVVARPSSASLDQFKSQTAAAMQCRRDDARLDALIVAADRYVKAGFPIDRLTPGAVEDRGFLPPNWVESKDQGGFTRAGLGLEPAEHGRVMIGVTTSAQCVPALAERYRTSAAEVRFPAPHRWGTKRLDVSREGKLALIFTPDKLAAAITASDLALHRAPP